MGRFMVPVVFAIASFGAAAWLLTSDLPYSAARPDASLWLPLIEPHATVIALLAIASGLVCVGCAIGRIGHQPNPSGSNR
jgi:hypothetical protein